MKALPAKPTSLPDLVRRAATGLAAAETSAEILEARQFARLARDVLKREAAMLKAKSAHGDVIAAVRRSQADALEIEALADKRLADEYDAAQERGEVASPKDGNLGRSTGERPATAADIGLSRKDIHEARKIRDAEAAEPGIVRRILDEKLAAGEEPTRASLRAGIASTKEERELPSQAEFNPLAVCAATPARDYDGLPADQRIAELEENIRVLESDYAALMTETKKYREMKVLFEKGGFEEVIAAKDELIRGMETRIYSESAGKAEWMRKAKFWEKQARDLGWRDTRRDKAPSEVPAEYDEAFQAAVDRTED